MSALRAGRRLAIILGLLCAGTVSRPVAAGAQEGSAFAPLRPDGNGQTRLAHALGVAIDTATRARALQAIAARAGLDLTFEPGLAALAGPAPRPSPAGTVAEALLVVVAGRPVMIEVSGGGALVVVPRAPSPDSAGTIRGRVFGAESAPVTHGTVGIVGRAATTQTDGRGAFEMRGLPAGDVTLRIHALGHRDVERRVEIPGGGVLDVVVQLTPVAARLGVVNTEARSAREAAFQDSPAVSSTSLGARDVRAAPSAVEADVLRTVQLLPGVSARNDYSASMNVRGGESEQNLILLDGYPIYNPFHLGGMFSTFIPAAVGDVTLLSGGFASRYGGRLSSVLDVTSREEVREGVHGSADLSLLATSASVAGLLGDGAGTWMVAGRRTYADQVVNAFKADAMPYHFRDVQVHVTHVLPGDARIAATVYEGRDIIIGSDRSDNFSWGNRVLGVTLSKEVASPPAWLGEHLGLVQRYSRSTFGTELDAVSFAAHLSSTTDETRLAGAATAYSAAHDRSIGYELASQRFGYDSDIPISLLPVDSVHQRATTASLYVDDLWRVSPRLVIEAGLRLDHLSGAGAALVSPRLSGKYFITPDVALTAATGRYTQSVHSLGREDVPLRLSDFWATSDSVLPVSTAWHYIAGVERRITPSRFLRVEGFLKRYDHLLEPNALSDPRIAGDEFVQASGRSYGLDVMLEQRGTGRFSGWVAYSLARSLRRTDSGEEYAPGQDRRHDLNLLGNWRGDSWTFSARFGLSTGTPYTAVLGDFDRREYDPSARVIGTQTTQGATQYLLGPRNAERLPTTHRLDVSVTRNGRLGGLAISPYLSVINADNARNPFAYFYDYRKSPPTRTGAPQFPILPSFGVGVAW